MPRYNAPGRTRGADAKRSMPRYKRTGLPPDERQLSDLRPQAPSLYSPSNVDKFSLTISVLVKRWNGRKLIVVPGDEDFPEDTFEPSVLAKRLTQGYQWLGMIESGEYPTIIQISGRTAPDPSVVTKTINMVNLSPKIQKLIVEADTPQSISLSKLFGAMPEDWEE